MANDQRLDEIVALWNKNTEGKLGKNTFAELSENEQHALIELMNAGNVDPADIETIAGIMAL